MIVNYVNYDPATGEILQSGTVDESLLGTNVKLGQAQVVVEAFTEYDSHYIDLKSKKPVNIGKRPYPSYRFDIDSKSWKPDVELESDRIRLERDRLLLESDWTQMQDVPANVRQKYQAYRKALRDLPQQVGFPLDITWPEV